MRKGVYKRIICYSVFIFFTSITLFSYNDTPDYWKCEKKISGSWTFGRAPYACDVSLFADDGYLFNQYELLIFDDNLPRQDETRRYLTELYAVLKETAKYYINLRNPNVSEEEESYFVMALLSVAHQESFWSHYRFASGDLKMMRGDYGHGHGVMQVDDRWHYNAIVEGRGWSLIGNIIYSLDEYYAGWKKAKSAVCVESETSWEEIARAAYSAYNGGLKQICRWTDLNHTWAANDKGFLEKLKNSSWNSYINDFNQNSSVDVACLAEGNEFCPPEDVTQDWEKRLLFIDEKVCVFKEETFHCTDDRRDFLCLSSISNFDDEVLVPVDSEVLNEYEINFYDRHKLCFKENNSLAEVSDFIKIKKNINVRKTPGGLLLGVSSKDKVYQVLDFEIRDLKTKKIYYFIEHEGIRGYIYAGDKNSYDEWTAKYTLTAREYSIFFRNNIKYDKENKKWVWVSGEAQDYKIIIPIIDSLIKITAPSGINLRETPGGKLITLISAEEKLWVLGTSISSSSNKIYHEVYFSGEVGFIYAGRIFPDFTMNDWVVLE